MGQNSRIGIILKSVALDTKDISFFLTVFSLELSDFVNSIYFRDCDRESSTQDSF